MTAYFYFGGTENDNSYYHDYSCIAEGLKELDIECYGNMNMCQVDLDGHYLINYDKQFDEKDADIDKILNWQKTQPFVGRRLCSGTQSKI